MMYMNDRMNAMPTMTIANARAHLGDVVGRVRHTGDRFILTARGKPAVAIVPVADLEAMEAAEDAADVAAARKALARIAAGDAATPWEDVKARLDRKHAKAKARA